MSQEKVKSKGHVCFARRVGATRRDESAWKKLDDNEVGDADVEFFVNKDGTSMCRALVSASLRLRKQDFNGRVRVPHQRVVTGVYHVKEVCKRLRCSVPWPTYQTEVKRQAEYASLDDLNFSSPISRKGNKMAKGKNSGMGVADTWAKLLIENEARHKKGQKPLTDPELVKVMEKEFPDKVGKTTLTRVSMIRGCYNKGTNLFANAGPAGSSTRPRSYAYDDDGTQLQARQRRAATKKAASKKTSKNANSKKKVSKKTSKKKVSKKKASKK